MEQKPTLFERLFGHRHSYWKPIVSMYHTFNERMVIRECSCGARVSYKVYYQFGEPMEIPTATGISDADFNAILGGAEYEYLTPHMVVLKKDLVVSN